MRSFANNLRSLAVLAWLGVTGLSLAAGPVAGPTPAPQAKGSESFGSRLPADGAVSGAESEQAKKPQPAGDIKSVDSAPEKVLPAKAQKDPNQGAPLNIPLLEGSPGLLLRIPDLDSSGRLRSLFVIGEVSKVDDRSVEIRDSFFETYKEDLSKDFSISMPKATLDLFSRVLLAKVPVTIWRAEFELRGATMEFDTSTREGGLGGPVEMIIYNGFGGADEPKPASKNKSNAAKGKAPR